MFPYVENHNFYVEHWALSVFWRKIRALGQILADAGFWPEADDIFYVRRDELQLVLYDYGNGWGTGRRDHRPDALAGRDRAQARHHRRARAQGAAAGDEQAARRS